MQVCGEASGVDFLLFAPDKPSLHAWRRAVIEHLTSLRLTLHEPEAAVFPVATGIPFLGFRVYPDHRRLCCRNGVAFARRFRALAADVAAGTVPVERLTAAVRGWVAHAAHADTYRLRASLLCHTPVPPAPIVGASGGRPALAPAHPSPHDGCAVAHAAC